MKGTGDYEVASYIGSWVDLNFVGHKVYTIWETLFKEKSTKLLYKIRHEHKFLFRMKKETKTSK